MMKTVRSVAQGQQEKEKEKERIHHDGELANMRWPMGELLCVLLAGGGGEFVLRQGGSC